MKRMCSPKWLKTLISAKEFRIIPAPLWRHVQSNAELSIEARFLWNVLWELCAVSPTFEKPLTWGFIGKRVGRSESTIRRWARTLQKSGYLEITDRHAKDGTQLPSIFKIGIPDGVAAQIEKETPNRKMRQEGEGGSSVELKAQQADVPTLEEPAGQSTQICQTISNTNGERKAAETPNQCLFFGVDASFSACESNPDERSSPVQTESVRNPDAQGQRPETHTPPMRDLQRSAEAPTGSAHARLSRLLKGLESTGKIRTPASAVLKRADQLVVEHLIESKRGIVLPARGHVGRKGQTSSGGGEGGAISAQTLGATFATQESKSFKENNRTRPFADGAPSEGLMAMVIKALSSRGKCSESSIERLAHEIAFSIEAGTFKDCSITKAINIAVKLVNEQRWTTPRLMQAAG